MRGGAGRMRQVPLWSDKASKLSQEAVGPLPRSTGRQAREGSAPVAPEQVPGNHQSLDFAGTLVDLRDASISIVPLGWHLCHIPHAAQDLDGLRGKTDTMKEKSTTTGERPGRDSVSKGEQLGKGPLPWAQSSPGG